MTSINNKRVVIINFCPTQRGLKFRRVRVTGHWDYNFYVVRRGSSFKLRLGLHHDLHPGVGVPLYDGLNPYEGLDVRVEPEDNLVARELESVKCYL